MELDPRGVDRAAEVLARAFQDDPGFVAALPDPSKRARALPVVQRVVVRYCVARGWALASSDALEGVLLCLPPEQPRVTSTGALRHGALAIPFKAGFGFVRRMSAIESVVARLKERHAPAGHAYFLAVGVDPPRQGKGIGGHLIRALLDRLSSVGAPCFLDTTKPANVGYYERFGFTRAETLPVPGLGVEVTGMTWRPPAGAST
ncbi:MAG: GNAT family N-acetyltransferase [Promethearchaeota archaeon]